MKRILVTGGCGFIGSNLVDELVHNGPGGVEVIVVDNLSSESASLNNQNEKVNYILDDIKNLESYTNERFDVIFHLAANARIQPSFISPHQTLTNNIAGTLAVLDYARKYGGKVIYAGSSSFYNGAKKSPYAFSKWAGEELCQLYQEIYNVQTVTARFFNVYGPRQPINGDFATVIGIFEREYAAGRNLPVVGDGTMRRDFTHVLDICEGLILLAEKDVSGTYNLGTGVNYSLNEIASKIIELGSKPIEINHIPNRKNEASTTMADISKTMVDIGYRPTRNLIEYLELVID